MPPDNLQVARSNSIAKRLIELESLRAGTVMVSHNPNLKRKLLNNFSRLGYTKPIFTSYHNFIFDAIFSNSELFGRVLPCSLLMGPLNKELANECWDGTGAYRGYQGFLALTDFSRADKNDIVMVIDIQPFFAGIEYLLDPVRNLPD